MRVSEMRCQAGAQAGRKARADAGLPEQVEDHRTPRQNGGAADQGGRSP
jgi:hypothetical protein